MSTLRRVLPAVILLVAVASCGSDDGTAEVSTAEAIRTGAADAASVLGPTWTPPERPYFADATIVARCGDPQAGLGAPGDGLLGTAMSPVLARAPADGDGPYGNVRAAVLAYRDAASAAEAARQLGVQAFERCLVDATNAYLTADAGDEPLPEATVESFDTSGPVASGDDATLIAGTFEEEVLGGFDNTHDAALYVSRRGPLVVTALAASNHQVPDPRNPASLARRVGSSALARAAAG